MDIDPLQDGPPARYAVESDSEDEVGAYPGPRLERAIRTYRVDVELSHGGTSGMIVACGPVGIRWANGIDGSVVGKVTFNDIEIGEYKLSPSGVLVLAISHRLPLAAQHPVARVIVERHTSKAPIVIVDSYSYLAYISNQSTRSDSHPMRYLSTSAVNTKIPAHPFPPPNLVQHLPAALVAECEYLEQPANILLAPVRSIPMPAPNEPVAYRLDDEEDISGLNLPVANALGVELGLLGWNEARAKSTSSRKDGRRRKSGDVGEGGMYI